MATPLQYSCLENPRDRGAWWAAVYGVAQSQQSLVPDSKNLYHNEDQSRELRPRQKKKKKRKQIIIEFLEYFSLNIKIMFVICSRTPFP